MKILMVAGSLSKESKTLKVLSKILIHARTHHAEHTFDLLDLRNEKMDLVDGRDFEEYSQESQNLAHKVESYDAYILGFPVYQFGPAGPFKNFLDLVSSGMQCKPVGIVVNSGGFRAYMVGDDIARILSHEVDTPILPVILHTSADDFKNGEVIVPEARLLKYLNAFVDFAKRLQGWSY